MALCLQFLQILEMRERWLSREERSLLSSRQLFQKFEVEIRITSHLLQAANEDPCALFALNLSLPLDEHFL
jgi:lipase chaperone LimK